MVGPIQDRFVWGDPDKSLWDPTGPYRILESHIRPQRNFWVHVGFCYYSAQYWNLHNCANWHIALYCNKETYDAIQYNASFKAETKWCKTIDCCCKWWFYWIVRQNLIKKGRWLRHAQYGSSMAQYGDLQKRIQKDIPVTRSSTPLWHWRAPYYKTDQNRKHK